MEKKIRRMDCYQYHASYGENIEKYCKRKKYILNCNSNRIFEDWRARIELDLIEFGLNVSEKAYSQEQEREKIIKEKLDYLFKWITFFITVINIAISFMMKQSVIDFQQKIFVGMYAVLMVVLILAMLVIVCLQFPRKIKTYPLGTDILKQIQSKPQEYGDGKAKNYKEILYKDAMTKQLRKSNDRALKGIVFANAMLIVAVICLALFLYGTMMRV